MRKLIYAINMTLDGCVDHTKGVGSDEMLEHYTHLLQEADLEVFGRKTYELMVPYWPDVASRQSDSRASIEFARAFVAIRKVVFSQTLAGVDDGNTKIIRANLQDEILRLKQEKGKSILVGGVDLASQLIELGLVDEYRFVIQPAIVGEGRRLFEGVSLPQKLQLRLVDSTALRSGFVALRYWKQ